MKKILLLICLLLMSISMSAQSVSYSYKALSAEGCKVEYTSVWQNGTPYIVIRVSSDRLVFTENPTIMMKLFDGKLIKIEGKSLGSTTNQGGVLIGNVMAPVSELCAMAQFPISEEQIDLLKSGVAKVRLSTIPLPHERTFKKDKIGQKLYSFFVKSEKNEENF